MGSIEQSHPGERKTAGIMHAYGGFKGWRSFVADHDDCPPATCCPPVSRGQNPQNLVKLPGLVDFNRLAERGRPTWVGWVEGFQNYGDVVHLWH